MTAKTSGWDRLCQKQMKICTNAPRDNILKVVAVHIGKYIDYNKQRENHFNSTTNILTDWVKLQIFVLLHVFNIWPI